MINIPIIIFTPYAELIENPIENDYEVKPQAGEVNDLSCGCRYRSLADIQLEYQRVIISIKSHCTYGRTKRCCCSFSALIVLHIILVLKVDATTSFWNHFKVRPNIQLMIIQISCVSQLWCDWRTLYTHMLLSAILLVGMFFTYQPTKNAQFSLWPNSCMAIHAGKLIRSSIDRYSQKPI